MGWRGSLCASVLVSGLIRRCLGEWLGELVSEWLGELVSEWLGE